jgi:hypothetical protein
LKDDFVERLNSKVQFTFKLHVIEGVNIRTKFELSFFSPKTIIWMVKIKPIMEANAFLMEVKNVLNDKLLYMKRGKIQLFISH